MNRYKGKPFITGLFGCNCHPFDSWEEMGTFHKQKLKVDQRVKNRCTGILGNVYEVCKGTGNYYIINWEPQKYPRDRGLSHAANLQLIEE